MALHNEIGKWGETIAADYLTSKGYAIVERNWRLGNYEIDIIAMHDNHIVFIEVKTRVKTKYDPAESVDSRRIRRLSRAAHLFLTTRDFPQEYRFDIIAINGNQENYTMNHIVDAFIPPLTTYR